MKYTKANMYAKILLAGIFACLLMLHAAYADEIVMGIVEDVPFPVTEYQAPELEGVYPETVEGFLPVCYGRRTDEKLVALTIDDCNQAGNLREIIRIISDNGGKATIFPIGENIPFLTDILRSAVDMGFEIENHTQTHSGLYWEDDAGLAYQIWQQNRSVSEALGVDYQMHFLRPRGGDNRYDQRTHSYMRQMGYYAIAYWSQVGSGNTAGRLMNDLNPGDIILFHTTDQDLATIRALVPMLRAQGYRMVTLNELYGLDENPQRTLTAGAAQPGLLPYARMDQTLMQGDYLHDVYLMQEKLTELGYLTGEYNGFFGERTVSSLKNFQTDAGLEATGVCCPETWSELFSR